MALSFYSICIGLVLVCAQHSNAKASSMPTQIPAGKVFRFRLVQDLKTLNWSSSEANPWITKLTARGLYQDLADKHWKEAIQPDLVESDSVSTDGKKWNFKIKPTKWSDQTPLKVEHICAALTHLPDFVECREGLAQSISLTLAKSISDLRAILAQPRFFPVRPDLISSWKDHDTNPEHRSFLGSFIVHEWAKGIRVILVPNIGNEAKPWLSKIEGWLLPEDKTAIRLFTMGSLEALPSEMSVELPYVPTLEALHGRWVLKAKSKGSEKIQAAFDQVDFLSPISSKTESNEKISSGHKKITVDYPDTPSGARIAEEFTTVWRSQIQDELELKKGSTDSQLSLIEVPYPGSSPQMALQALLPLCSDFNAAHQALLNISKEEMNETSRDSIYKKLTHYLKTCATPVVSFAARNQKIYLKEFVSGWLPDFRYQNNDN